MDPLLSWARRNQPKLIQLIREFVECESPSDSPEGLRLFMQLLAKSRIVVAEMTATFEPRLHIPPESHRRLWPELDAVPSEFVLYAVPAWRCKLPTAFLTSIPVLHPKRGLSPGGLER